MDLVSLEKRLAEIQMLAEGTRWQRWWHDPLRYTAGVGYWRLCYPWHRKGLRVRATTFFGVPMVLRLPAATEIFLFGAKTHPSEILLTRFLMRSLRPGHVFCDAGAHVGYFSLLAAALVGPQGRVHAFEPTPSTFGLLSENTRRHSRITAVPGAATDTDTVLPFHEFPVLYSEYNSLGPPAGKSAAWLAAHPPRIREVRGIRLDGYFAAAEQTPDVVKIDVEGSECQVLQGMGSLLDGNHPPLIVMEYHREGGQRQAHRSAVDFARQKGFRTLVIQSDGSLRDVPDVEAAMQERRLDSDNIVLSRD